MNRSWTQGLPAAITVAVVFVVGMLLLDTNEVVFAPGVRLLVAFVGAALAVMAGVGMAAYKRRHSA